MFEYLILEHVATFRVKRNIGYTKSPFLAKEAGEMVCFFVLSWCMGWTSDPTMDKD